MRRAALAAALTGVLALPAAAQHAPGPQTNAPLAPGEAVPVAMPAFVPPSALAGMLEAMSPQDAEATDTEAAVEPLPASDKGTAPAPATAATQDTRGTSAAAPVVAAKTIFGAASSPAPLAARSIGFYARGCLAGAIPVPIDGETWQVMRLSRNRNWGHPDLVRLLERLAEDGAAKDGWPGLLVGDISQPRGGPMLTGHNSHQIGLDADVWLTPMPDRRLSAEEREKLAATSMLGKDGVHADATVFTPHHAAIIRRAASYPQVERVLVHPGIKKAMCEEKSVDRSSFHKIRPYWGHHYHMHIRIACPKGSVGCVSQAPTGNDDGCGKEVDDWIALLQRPRKPVAPPTKPVKPKPPVTLADLPPECRMVVSAGARTDGPAAEHDSVQPAKVAPKPGPKAAQGR